MTACAAAISLLALAAAPRFTESAIAFDDGFSGRWFADFDGDRRLDLAAGVVKKGSGRELRIFLQRADGGFPAEPDRRVVLKSDIVAFAIAEAREEPGEELLFFTGSSCFSYSTALEGFAGNARKVFSWDLLLDLPDPEELIHLEAPAASKGGGRRLLVLPGPDGHGLFAVPGSGGPEVGPLALIPEEADGRRSFRRSSRRIEIGVRADREESIGHRVVRTAPWGIEGGGPFLDVERWLSAAIVADADGDGRLDVFRLANDSGGPVLEIRLQDAAGRFPESPSWSGPFTGGGRIRVEDWNGDGRADLMVGEQGGISEHRWRFHRNRNGAFDGKTPDQVMKFSGLEVHAEVADLDGDGRPELAVSNHEIPASSALSGGRVVRSLFLYRPDPDHAFSARPALKYEESFDAKALKGIAQRVQLGADLSGRGVRDLIFVDRDGALAAKHLGKDLSLESEPFFRFTPQRMILRFKALDLNGDGRSDLILNHQRSLTILVSRS